MHHLYKKYCKVHGICHNEREILLDNYYLYLQVYFHLKMGGAINIHSQSFFKMKISYCLQLIFLKKAIPLYWFNILQK